MNKNRRKPSPIPPPREVSIADAISESFGEIDCLKDEMIDWQSSLEERFSSTQKYEDVSEVVSSLENISEPTVHDILSDLKVTIQDPRPRQKWSRSDRMGTCTEVLQLIMDKLDEMIEDKASSKKMIEEAESLREEIDSAKDECDGVEFPGMY